MALVKCPKCGESVSSTAKMCIHCGAAFSAICFECGGLLLEGEEVCRGCGAAKEAEEKILSATEASVVKNQKAAAETEKEERETKIFLDGSIETREKRDKKFGLIISILSIVGFGLVLLMLIPWALDIKSDLKLISSKEAKTIYCQEMLMQFLSLAIGILMLFNFVIAPFRIVQIFTTDKTQKEDLEWLGKEKYQKYFTSYFKTQVVEKFPLDMMKLLTAAYIVENPAASKRSMVVKVLRTVVTAYMIFLEMVLFFWALTYMGEAGTVGFYDKLLLTLFFSMLPSLICGTVGIVLENRIKKEVKQWAMQFKN